MKNDFLKNVVTKTMKKPSGRIKGWTKTGKNVWENGLTLLVVRTRQLASKQLKVGAYDLDVHTDIGWTSEKRIYGNTFKTKEQAIKEAVKYMRANPNS